jgi:hypothetical protein
LGLGETVLFCASRMRGTQIYTNAQFFKRFVEGRLPLTKAVYYILQLRNQYYLGEYESALEMVYSSIITSLKFQGNLAKEHLSAMPRYLEEIGFYFYRSLNLLTVTPRNDQEREIFLDEVLNFLPIFLNF